VKYTVVCVAVLKDHLKRDVEELDFEPLVAHVEAENVQEAEFEAAAQNQHMFPVTKRLRFIAVFDDHLTDLKTSS
jgi:hypothetical protein